MEGDDGVSINKEIDRSSYLGSLRMIGHLCHEYHLEFSLQYGSNSLGREALSGWYLDLIHRISYVNTAVKGIKKLLYGMSPKLIPYNSRVNHESGVGTEISAEDYWLKQIESVGEVNRSGRKINLELRAKG